MSSSTFNSDHEIRTWRVFLRRAALFVAMLWVVLWTVDTAFNWGFSQGIFYKQQWVNSIRDQSFDLVVLGSSRSLTTIDTAGLAERTGLSVVNLSLDGSGPADQLCLVKMFLEDNHNTAKRILLQVDHWALTGPGNVDSSYRFFLPFRNRKSVSQSLAVAYPESGRSYRLRDAIPMVSYGRSNSYWSLDKLANSLHAFQKPTFGELGSHLIDRSYPTDAPTQCVVPQVLAAQFRIINEITEVCRTNGIEVLMFTAPWFDRQDRGGWQAQLPELAALADHFHDFGDLYRGRRELFYDLSHLNKAGAMIFTEELASAVVGTKSVNGTQAVGQ